MWDVDFAAQATKIVRGRLNRAGSTPVKPYKTWLSEDYPDLSYSRDRRLARM